MALKHAVLSGRKDGKSKGRARYVHPEIGVNGLIAFWGMGDA